MASRNDNGEVHSVLIDGQFLSVTTGVTGSNTAIMNNGTKDNGEESEYEAKMLIFLIWLWTRPFRKWSHLRVDKET